MRGKTADDIFSFENRCFGDFQLTPLTLSSLAGSLSGKVFNLSAEVRENWPFQV